MPSLTASRLAVFGVIAVVIALVGCNSYPPASLSGEVRYEGAPLAAAGIRLYPIRGTKGWGAAAIIKGGRYDLPLGSGLAPGTYRVEISAVQKTGKQVPDIDEFTGKTKGMVDEYATLVPEQYNTESTLEVTLRAGANTHDFNLP